MAGQPPAQSPLDTLLPGDIVANSIRLIRTRWVAGALIIAATALSVHVFNLPLPEWALYATGVGVLAYNALLCRLMLRIRNGERRSRAGQVQRIVVAQVVLDWAAMAVFLHLTGGVTSPAIPFLLIHMLMVTILLPGQHPFLFVAMGIAVLTAITLAERSGLLLHYRVIPALPADLHRSPAYIAAQLFFFAVTAFAIVYLASTIMNRLRERERQIGALFEATNAVSSTLSLEEVMERLARSAAEALSVPSASIRVLDDSAERLTMTASYGLSREYIDKGAVDLARSPLDRDALRGAPVIIDEAHQDGRIQYPQAVAEEGIRSMVVVPVMGKQRPLGVLRVYSDQPARFTLDDAAFVMAIARQGAMALENALTHEALRKEERSRAQYVRLVTHELRAPVGGAQSLLRTLLRGLAGDVTEQQRDILGRVERRLGALMDLIEDLLALAASKTPELQGAPQIIPLQPVVQEVVERWRPQAEEKSVALLCELGGPALPVRATYEGLARIFDNLVGNAVKYTPAGGRVQVRVTGGPAGAAVRVQDDGIGIPAEDIPRLWDEFFRASNARASGTPGTGLGLSIVRALVESYGGVIGVQSEVGAGTTFIVTLPLQPAE